MPVPAGLVSRSGLSSTVKSFVFAFQVVLEGPITEFCVVDAALCQGPPTLPNGLRYCFKSSHGCPQEEGEKGEKGQEEHC